MTKICNDLNKTLEDTWGWKTQNDKKFSKSLKEIVKTSIKLRVFSDRLFVSSHGGGVHRGADEKEVGGGGQVGGSTMGLSSTSKKSSSQHKFKSPKQFELKQSWKVLRALNARWALPIYPVFEDEKSKASDEKSVKRKIALKKTDRTNIIATNFVWE